MSKAIWWSIVLFGCGLFAAIIYYALPKPPPAPATQPAMPVITKPPAFTEPPISHPILRPLSEKPLPALDVSDTPMRTTLVELLSDKMLIDLFQIKDFVRRIVAAVDNLPRQKAALRLMPVKSVIGPFRVSHKDGRMAIATDNAERYTLYVRLAAALDTTQLVSAYIHFYPLFQQAYQELGYPKAYFNDRLIEVIDHLLAAPEMNEPLTLAQPKVLYIFVNPDTEALSAGQKIMIRIGNENAAIVKAKLREIRGGLTRLPTTGLRSPILQ